MCLMSHVLCLLLSCVLCCKSHVSCFYASGHMLYVLFCSIKCLLLILCSNAAGNYMSSAVYPMCHLSQDVLTVCYLIVYQFHVSVKILICNQADNKH